MRCSLRGVGPGAVGVEEESGMTGRRGGGAWSSGRRRIGPAWRRDSGEGGLQAVVASGPSPNSRSRAARGRAPGQLGVRRGGVRREGGGGGRRRRRGIWLPYLDPDEGERGTWEERVGGSGRVGWRLGLRGDKERSGVGRVGLWPVGPARSGGGGQLGHLAQWGGGSVVFVLFYFPFICFFLFIFLSVLFNLKYLCIF